MLKAVLFDLDDTLIDWGGFKEEWPVLERRYLYKVFDYICREKCDLSDFEAFAAEFRTRTSEAWNTGRGNMVAPHLGKILVASAEAVGVPVGAVEAPMPSTLELLSMAADPQKAAETMADSSDFRPTHVSNRHNRL